LNKNGQRYLGINTIITANGQPPTDVFITYLRHFFHLKKPIYQYFTPTECKY